MELISINLGFETPKYRFYNPIRILQNLNETLLNVSEIVISRWRGVKNISEGVKKYPAMVFAGYFYVFYYSVGGVSVVLEVLPKNCLVSFSLVSKPGEAVPAL